MKLTIAHYLFTPEELSQLRAYRDHQPDGRLRSRFEAFLMVAEDIPLDTVARVIGKSIRTIERWGQQFFDKGIECLNAFNYQGKSCLLSAPQLTQLVTWVTETNPSTTKHVRTYVLEQFRVAYTCEAIRQILHKQGLTRLRPRVQPGKPPSEATQREFVANYEQMKAESAPGTVFLFLDAMHLVHQNTPGLCWGDPKNPPVIKTNSGRKRLNILGGYKPDDYSVIHVTGEASCNAERVVELFERILQQHAAAPEIIMFSDNAKYFYAPSVREWIEAHPSMWLLPLPAYAPNLNLIERLWKFVKEHLVKNTYYEHYKTFRAHVFRFLNHLENYTDALHTLMVEKFQIIQPKTA